MVKILSVLALLTSLACTTADQPGQLKGTVTWQGQPITMALVEAYPKPERDPNTLPVGETPSAEDGRFTLELPPGEYWIWARVTVPTEFREQRLVGEAEGNPVRIRPGSTVEIAVPLADATGFASATGPAGTGVGGAVSGADPRQVTIYAYTGNHDRPLGPGFRAAVPAREDGSFQLDLAPGEYTLAARWRASGADHGSLEPGDRVSVSQLSVVPGEYTDAGTLPLREVDEQVWQTVGRRELETPTGIAGRIVDAEGNPKGAIRVLVFDDPRMAGKPLALSAPSDNDGAFRVHVPHRGRFYLGARSRIGGPAEPGEWTGTFRGEDGDGIVLDSDTRLEGVQIQVEEVW